LGLSRRTFSKTVLLRQMQELTKQRVIGKIFDPSQDGHALVLVFDHLISKAVSDQDDARHLVIRYEALFDQKREAALDFFGFPVEVCADVGGWKNKNSFYVSMGTRQHIQAQEFPVLRPGHDLLI
jgi:hypothetical protein